MNGEAVKEIAALAKGERKVHILDIHGEKVLMTPTADGGWLREERGGPGALPQPITLHTLTGFVSYVNEVVEDKDHEERKDLVIHVKAPDAVHIFTGNDEDFAHRELLAAVGFAELLGPAGMVYGQFMNLEAFNIALQAVFENSEDKERLLLLVGTVRQEEVATSTDDGVSQTVIAQAGVVASTRATVPNPVRLKPYRTFREVEQPESLFVVRMKRGNEGTLPTVALFEADGGRWKLDAIENIRKYLADKIAGIPILA